MNVLIHQSSGCPIVSKVTFVTVMSNDRNCGSIYPHLDRFFNKLVRLVSQKTSKLPIAGPLWEESTDDRWIPLIKGQLCGTTQREPDGIHHSDAHSLPWHHNERDGVSNHRRLDCLLTRLFRRRSKKTPKLRVAGLCEGNSPVTSEFPLKGPSTRKIFPFDDVIVYLQRFPYDEYDDILNDRQWHSWATYWSHTSPNFLNIRHMACLRKWGIGCRFSVAIDDLCYSVCNINIV